MATWPGFEPGTIPLALYDGVDTVLLGHPSPPPEFSKEGDEEWVFKGLHPSVRANSSALIGGVQTATVFPHEEQDLQDAIIHEKFHVFQMAAHPDWSADERNALLYPIDNAELLALRRMEMVALRRAVVDESAGWTAAAFAVRKKRFEMLPDWATEYERQLERHEGLAFYMEGRRACVTELAKEHAPDKVRLTAYFIGEAMAWLLDGFLPGWKQRLEADDSLFLDELLQVEHAPEEFSEAEIQRFRSAAEHDAELVKTTRRELREAFLLQKGHTKLDATDEPFEIAGADPMNLHYLGDGEVLHLRWVKIRGNGFEIEVLDRRALTVSAGESPLADGVRTVFL